MLYALSTCGWCAKTREFLDELGVSYSYVYIDLLSDKDNAEAVSALESWNPRVSFPTVVINDQVVVVGYHPDMIEEALD